METPKRAQVLSVIAAVLFVTVAMAVGYRRIGLPPVVIVGGSSLVALVLWIKTYLRRPLDPEIILPGFLLTVAALEVHMVEEYLTGFGPAMSRLFDISWTEQSFLMVFAFVGPTPAIQPELAGRDPDSRSLPRLGMSHRRVTSRPPASSSDEERLKASPRSAPMSAARSRFNSRHASAR